MKKKAGKFFFLILLFIISPSLLWAQSSTTETSTQFDTTGFPRWAKDLRRAEIITFGSFPFAYFFANFAFDAYRWSNHGWDNRYAPWPFNSAATVEQTQDEKIMTLGIAAGTAILISVIDNFIMRYKRNRLEREAILSEGTPIVIRKPLYEEEEALPESENP
jgi:hypothetical protein